SHPHINLLLFSLLLRPPPRPTLFPYTTLFRSLPLRGHRRRDDRRLARRVPCGQYALQASRRRQALPRAVGRVRHEAVHVVHARRSEEHTSELQSLAYLVCRLLLEKKKENKYYI